MKKLFLLLITIIFISCTDATIANLKSYGDTHRIQMYNGGVLVREWYSTGKVTSLTDSDGWQFMDRKTKKLVRVGGDVIIEVMDN